MQRATFHFYCHVKIFGDIGDLAMLVSFTCDTCVWRLLDGADCIAQWCLSYASCKRALSLQHTIFHSTTLSHTIFATPCFTHNFVKHHLSFLSPHHLSHATLAHTIFHTPSQTIFHTPSLTHPLSHTQLCHTPSFTTPSFTHNFVTHTHHLSLSHTIFHRQLCHTQLFLLFDPPPPPLSFPSPLQHLLLIIGKVDLWGCPVLSFYIPGKLFFLTLPRYLSFLALLDSFF